MKKLLCIFTLLVLITATVYAEPKKDTQAGLETFTEEQIQSVSNLILPSNPINKEITELLNTVMEENMTPNMGEQYSETRLKRFFDSDPYGVKKYAETSNAVRETYNRKCPGGRTINSTDDINWTVEKTHGSAPVSKRDYDIVVDDWYYLYFNEYDFGIECYGMVYVAYKLCFTTAKYIKKGEKVHEYVDCDVYRANINKQINK